MRNRGGRTARVAEALETYEGSLTLYALRILGDEERARDVVQDTFLRLCERPPDSLDGQLASWLFTVCRNRALDLKRREQRMTTTATETPAPAEAGAPELAQSKDDLRAVLAEVERLPSGQQEVVRLKFQHGLTYREIARVTEHSVTNVGFMIHQALKALRARLARDHVEETAR